MPPLLAQRCALHALLLVVLLAGACAAPALGSATSGPSARAHIAARCSGTHSSGAGPRHERAILCLVNRQRARFGLRRLRARRTLARAAERHARDMARHNYFAHYGRRGSTPRTRVRRSGYRCRTVGENLAFGRGYPGTPAGIVAMWMASPPHRRTMLSRRVRDLGVGAARGVPRAGIRGGVTVAAEFARR
jgi:uncharacterized protein YkwD